MNKHHKQNRDTYETLIRTNGRGVGFVTLIDPPLDIRIESRDVHTALSGDLVEIRLHPEKANKPRSGEVVRLIKRNTTTFVGTLYRKGGDTLVRPQNNRIYTKFRLNADDVKDIPDDYKVLIKLESWENPSEYPTATLIRSIGPSGDHETEIAAILDERGIDSRFKGVVEDEAQRLKKNSAAMLARELETRKDYRDVLTFTIDPDDAKDFDDALSYQTLPNGNIEIGVHIADVSHYVHLGAPIDAEAQKRGTSVYLVDRTIPMLPEILSNDLCSLNPNEDKLAFSVLFEFSPESIKDGTPYELLSYTIAPVVIHSDTRFTYAEAEEVLETGEGKHADELRALNTLAKKIDAENKAKGALSFHQDEVKFVLDDTGKPIDVILKKTGQANKLIEDFMLLANKTVTEYVDGIVPKNERVFLYRIHDKPSIEALEELSVLFREFGHTLPIEEGTLSKPRLNTLLDSIQDEPEAHLLNISTIRSMEKAVYSTKNVGHFGLGFTQYTHFTSPIRRYPDVIVHRLLKSYLAKNRIPSKTWQNYKHWSEIMSEMERKAMEAERASIKFKQVEYMEQFVGKEIDGTISGVTEWGIFVQDNHSHSEGLLPLRDLKDDYYVFEKAKKRIVGKKTKRVFQLGDPLRVKVARVDAEDRTIDFALPDS